MIYEMETETGQAVQTIGDEMSQPTDVAWIRDWRTAQPELQLGLQEVQFSASSRRPAVPNHP